MKNVTLLAIVSTLLCSSVFAAQQPSDALAAAVAHADRTPANTERDRYRNPVATLSFFDVTPQSTVVEISPGAGWYTEILAPLLNKEGTYYAAHFPADSQSGFYQRSRAAFIEKLAANPAYSKVIVTEFAPGSGKQIAPPASADVVLTFRNLHNWYSLNNDETIVAAFKSFFDALKPGGVLGVVEHRLPAQQQSTDWTKTGYFPQALAIELAQQAGFVFEASSEINANPKDSADHAGGVWSLPPTLRQGEQDKAHYLAIGESDRMTLKFRKPLN